MASSKPRRSGRKRNWRGTAPLTARPQTETAVVSSPYTPGKTDTVERVVDELHRQRHDGRIAGKITEEQYQAGQIYRAAYETLAAGPCGTLDPDRVGGGGFGSRCPALAEIEAARMLKICNSALGAVGARTCVEHVVGMGGSLESFLTHHGLAHGQDRVGRGRLCAALTLRDGLTALVVAIQCMRAGSLLGRIT